MNEKKVSWTVRALNNTGLIKHAGQPDRTANEVVKSFTLIYLVHFVFAPVVLMDQCTLEGVPPLFGWFQMIDRFDFSSKRKKL